MQVEYNSFIESTKGNGLFIFRKKAEDIKGLFLKALRMKSLSCTENTELARAISERYFARKDYILTMTESTKYSRRLTLQ